MIHEEFGLKEDHIECIRSVLDKHPRVEQAILFGSRAGNRHQPGSDIDLALVGEQLTLDDLLIIRHDLESLWLPVKCDVLDLKTVRDQDLAERIRKEGKRIY
ncbi:nucleotidyltransferase domain-containing protein [Natronogracilivirga saccharolytica]|uniref:Nucleotidyltransferase domain-containing protein n=1 Tax=Natronogracilivirga saccharolytica TaxID=2812953 RepID=A0A8J7RQ21_9BACT|nr:nucleotidyltransferase domain-containing protein [Natronogracilivirga saccharolytica]MBP3193834.1 nucleotidyltransferase domain-containing protein [Natronogracilivirga saccharolytica]